MTSSPKYLLQAGDLDFDEIVKLTEENEDGFISRQVILVTDQQPDVGFVIATENKIVQLWSAKRSNEGLSVSLITRSAAKSKAKGKAKAVDQETLPMERKGTGVHEGTCSGRSLFMSGSWQGPMVGERAIWQLGTER